MAEVFLKILNMSITATCVLFAILVLRLLLKRAPKRISYALWGVLLFRLVCPVSFSSFFSLFGLLRVPVAENGGLEYIAKGNMPAAVQQISYGAGFVGAASSPEALQAAETASADPMHVFLFIGAWIWIAGLALMLVYCLVSCLRLKKRVSTAVPLCGNVFETDEICSPFVCGFFKPRIYLPPGVGEAEREYILLHERAHILRKDHIVKLAAFLALSIHWFNPFMWLVFRLMSRDMEMSCDERAARGLDREGKARYGETLMRLATKRPIPAGNPLAFGEGVTKGRIKHMLNNKKPAFWIVCAAAVAAAAGAVLLTANPAQTLELPGTASVFTVEMEQFNDRLSIGRVVITDAEQIETILSAMAGAKKTLGRSVNDYPTQEKYLVVRLIMENEMRTLCLYSEGGGEYIEEPYIGIYKTRGNLGEVLYRVYTDNMDRTSGSAINIKWEASDDVPQPVRDYAADYVREQVEYYNSLGYNITDAKITAVTHINTGTAGLTKDIGMWRLEYRLLPDDADKVVLAGGMNMEDGWLTEWGSTGQPYLVLACDDAGTERTWRRVCVTNTDVIEQEYGTPEMLKQYGNEFTAAAMELYKKSLEIRTIGQVPAVYTRREELGHTAVQKVAELLVTKLLNDLKTEQDGRTFIITDWKNISVSADRVYDAWVVAGDVEVRYEGLLSPIGDSSTVPQGEYVSVSIGERYLRHEDGVYTLSLSAGERRAVLEPPLLTPDMSTGIGVIPDYEDGGILIFHGYFGLFVYDLKAEKITFAADLKKAVGSDIIQGSEGAAVRVSADGHTIQLFYYPEQGEPKMAYTIDARIGSYTYGEYAPIDPCFSTPDELYGRFSGSTLGELAYTDGQKSFPLLSDWVWAD